MKATEKKTTTPKKVKKKFKPAFVVDATGVEDPKELLAAYGIAKQNAGIVMTEEEFEAIIETVTQMTIDQIFDGYNCVALAGGKTLRFDITGLSSLFEDTCRNECECCHKTKKKNFFSRMWNKVFH